MNSKRALVFTVVLVIAIIIGCWFALLIARNLLREHEVSLQNPDFFMHNVFYVQMDENGQIKNEITAPVLTHYPNDDVSVFTQPHLLVFKAADKLWDISADQGRSEAFLGTIYLTGNVNVERLPTPNDLGFTVKTIRMTVYPDSKTAETKEPVTILQGGSIVDAVGAKADLAKGTVDLLSRVKGNYNSDEK